MFLNEEFLNIYEELTQLWEDTEENSDGISSYTFLDLYNKAKEFTPSSETLDYWRKVRSLVRKKFVRKSSDFVNWYTRLVYAFIATSLVEAAICRKIAELDKNSRRLVINLGGIRFICNIGMPKLTDTQAFALYPDDFSKPARPDITLPITAITVLDAEGNRDTVQTSIEVLLEVKGKGSAGSSTHNASLVAKYEVSGNPRQGHFKIDADESNFFNTEYGLLNKLLNATRKEPSEEQRNCSPTILIGDNVIGDNNSLELKADELAVLPDSANGEGKFETIKLDDFNHWLQKIDTSLDNADCEADDTTAGKYQTSLDKKLINILQEPTKLLIDRANKITKDVKNTDIDTLKMQGSRSPENAANKLVRAAKSFAAAALSIDSQKTAQNNSTFLQKHNELDIDEIE